MKSGKRLKLVYLSGFLLAIHYASVVYLNSSLLKRIVNDDGLSLLYVIGSGLSILFLFLVPTLLQRIGNKTTFLIFIALEMLAVFGLANTSLALTVLALFILHHGAESILNFSLDISLEKETLLEGTTGSKRGVYFTVQNVAWVLSPLALSFLINFTDFSKVYTLSALALLPLFLITILFFKNYKGADTKSSEIASALFSIWKGGDKARIVVVHFFLNFFYSWMVIFMPLLLNIEMGFGWDKIGIIFTIMLLPFLLFELPAGFLADKKWGERELLFVGISIMAFFTALIPFLHSKNFLLWAILLFMTRVGASLVEIGSETYFFKQVKRTDTATISLFRMLRPLSFILAPLLAIPVISLLSYGSSFGFLALITLSGLLFVPKKDTK